MEDFGYYAMKQLFQEGKITFVELCEYYKNKTIPQRLISMESKEIKITPPEGYEVDRDNSTFEKIVFKKKENKLPKSWEEYFLKCPTTKSNEHLQGYAIPSMYCEAFIALNKLIRLRDVYNDGWKPDWSDDCWKSCIFYSKGEIEINSRQKYHCVLSFKSIELRDEFYNNFKDLIEQAKELL